MKIRLENLTIDRLKEMIMDLERGIKGMERLPSLLFHTETDESSSNSLDMRMLVYFALTLLCIAGVFFSVFQYSEAEALSEDVNKDGIVNIQDLVLVSKAFGQTADPNADQNSDVNSDGIVNVIDLVQVSNRLGERGQEVSIDGSIANLANAMQTFRESLSSELLSDILFSLEDRELYSWSNLPVSISNRGGVSFGELSAEQLELFYKLLSAFLSDDGYTKVSLITKEVEAHLSKISPGFWDPNHYHIALFENARGDDAWGFQLDGHHLALNFLVHNDEVFIVPAFIGSEPATINGIEVFEAERSRAFALLNSLDPAQRETAIQTENRGLQMGPGRSTDPHLNPNYSAFEGIGLKASEMSGVQKEYLRHLIKAYVYNLETEFADIWMADIDAGLDNTYFVWIGGTTTNNPIYYRVFNPAVWIEFNNEGRGNNLDHIHTITRAPNGNDYGIFALNHGPKTLLEHYTIEDHHKMSIRLFDYSLAGLQDSENMVGH